MSLELVYPQSEYGLAHFTARFTGTEITPVVLKTQAEVKKVIHEEGSVPVLRTSEGNITGSTSIARYFALSSKPELLGEDDIQKTKVDEYLNLIDLEILPNSRGITYLLTGRAPCESQHKLNVIVTELKKKLEGYNKVLEGQDFLLGSTVTLADLQLATYIAFPLSFVMNAQWRNKVLNLVNWFYRVTGLEGHYEATFGKVKFNTKVLQAPKPPKVDKKKKDNKKESKEEKKDKKEKKEKKKEKKDDLPPTKLNLDDFKRFIVNNKEPAKAAEWLEKEFEKDAWSIYHLKYDIYKDEGTKLHITSNLMNGFVERAEACRRGAFGIHCVLGDEPNLGIEGIWMWRGQDVMKEMKEHPTYEYYEGKKLDTTNKDHAALIVDFWTKYEGEKIQDRTIQRRTHM
eukprot:CAMPEP_0196997330 /NCGR_PEP_ID=MMETSP1380-20130617/2973_1 /TAXON_ID=5936 /ORGANISM="Euplotes crassus, Strain CT5" /LENGTH=399 /DNA_ID=CAMNT_0042413531 /DNA_START=15 /DNA_END=1214 /DNA_ORIENTATION=+